MVQIERFRANPRVSPVLVSVSHDACHEIFGTYPKDQVPEIPMDCCSHPLGCRSFYQPFLNYIYP